MSDEQTTDDVPGAELATTSADDSFDSSLAAERGAERTVMRSIVRSIAMTVFALSALMIGMPKMGLVLSCRAAGFTTSFAPTTIATSSCGMSGLMSSISESAV